LPLFCKIAEESTMNRSCQPLLCFVLTLISTMSAQLPSGAFGNDRFLPPPLIPLAPAIPHQDADAVWPPIEFQNQINHQPSAPPVWPGIDESPFPSAFTGNAAWTDATWDWRFLPEGLLYHSYLAGEKEPRLSNTFFTESGGQTLWDSTLGWRVGLIRFGTTRGIQPEGLQIDVEGGTFLRVLPNEGNDLQSIDFRAGIPLTWREGPFQAKVAAYHVESHVGDDYLAKHPGFVSNKYDRTAIVFGVGYFVFDSLRLYTEVGWGISGAGGDKPFEWQSGLEWSSPHATGLRGSPYFAANVHLREATYGSGSVNVLAGWQWRRSQSEHLFRVGLQYFGGKNNQYSFLQDNQQLFGFGVRYDY